MKAKLMLIVCIFLCLEGYSQESTLMRGKGYAGYSFNKSHGVFMSIENQQERYTPTKEDIVLAEKILKDSIKNVLGRQKNFSTSINLTRPALYGVCINGVS